MISLICGIWKIQKAMFSLKTEGCFTPLSSRIKMKSESVSCSLLSDSATPWTVAPQAPLSTGFSGQEYWSGLPCPPPGDLPNPGIEPGSLTLQAISCIIVDWFFTNWATREALCVCVCVYGCAYTYLSSSIFEDTACNYGTSGTRLTFFEKQSSLTSWLSVLQSWNKYSKQAA